MDPDEPQVLRRGDRAALREGVAPGDRRAELAVEHARPQVGVSVRGDPRRHAEPDVLGAGSPGDEPAQPVDLVSAVDDDATDAQAQRGAEPRPRRSTAPWTERAPGPSGRRWDRRQSRV